MLNAPSTDLAGKLYLHPTHFQTQSRINYLISHYLSFETLHDRLQELPKQYEKPQPRAWSPVDWHAITPEQVVGVDLETFLSVVVGALDVEAPIRDYSHVSWHYLKQIHAPMARFVGGTFADDGSILELGLWEKEERQHTPAFIKIHYQLTGQKIAAKSSTVKNYHPSSDPREDLYRHGLHRVATEYGATGLYVWLMAHSTGALQQVIAEMVQDEVNHFVKFWGWGQWAFPESALTRLVGTIGSLSRRKQAAQGSSSRSSRIQANYWVSGVDLVRTFRRVMGLMDWSSWSAVSKLEMTFTFARVLLRMLMWSRKLTPEHLRGIFGEPPLQAAATVTEELSVDWSRTNRDDRSLEVNF